MPMIDPDSPEMMGRAQQWITLRIKGALTEQQLHAELLFGFGWIGALQLEGLITVTVYDRLSAEFEALHDAQRVLLRQ